MHCPIECHFISILYRLLLVTVHCYSIRINIYCTIQYTDLQFNGTLLIPTGKVTA
jgi:hypothetical protein